MSNLRYACKAFLPAALGIAAVWALSLNGCGSSRAGMATVRGRVTIGGKGVPHGTIVFYPEQGRPALGELDADGYYQLSTFSTGDGALVGAHLVTIRALELNDTLGRPTSVEEELRGLSLAPENAAEAPVWIVPERYADRETTPLRAEVAASGNNIDFDIPAKP